MALITATVIPTDTPTVLIIGVSVGGAALLLMLCIVVMGCFAYVSWNRKKRYQQDFVEVTKIAFAYHISVTCLQ